MYRLRVWRPNSFSVPPCSICNVSFSFFVSACSIFSTEQPIPAQAVSILAITSQVYFFTSCSTGTRYYARDTAKIKHKQLHPLCTYRIRNCNARMSLAPHRARAIASVCFPIPARIHQTRKTNLQNLSDLGVIDPHICCPS